MAFLGTRKHQKQKNVCIVSEGLKYIIISVLIAELLILILIQIRRRRKMKYGHIVRITHKLYNTWKGKNA